jgi:hypothetical protein
MKNKTNWLLTFCVTLFIFLIYLASLCPTLYLIDSGELATVSYTLGVAHPTGYPLYTLISFFFSHLPGSPIFNLNLLSALFSSLAAGFLLYGSAFDQRDSTGSLADEVHYFLPAFLFAFAPTVWRTSVTNEVYPLTGLFCVLILFLLFRVKRDRDLYILAYVLGLAFTNHMIVFSLALPVIIYAIVVHRLGLKKIIFSTGFFVLGLSLYLYLITRTRGGAEIAWGNVCNIQRLIWHITGKQYRVWMFSSNFTEISRNLTRGLEVLGRNLLYLFIIPVLTGFYCLLKKARKKFFLLLAIILLNILYTINYSIPDIESYYIPSLVALVFAVGFGLNIFWKYLKWFIALPIALALPLINYRDCTLRDNAFGRDYGFVHVDQLPVNALLVSVYWDVYSPIMYLRNVEGVRKDLVVVDKELLRRTWYIKYLQREYPDFMTHVQGAVNKYLPELVKFEYGRPYDSYTIQKAYLDLLTGMVDVKMKDGVFFAMPYPDRDLDQVKPDYSRRPYGPDIQIAENETLTTVFDFKRLRLHKPKIINDPRLGYNAGFFKNMIKNNVPYLRAMNQADAAAQAEAWLKKF